MLLDNSENYEKQLSKEENKRCESVVTEQNEGASESAKVCIILKWNIYTLSANVYM